MRHTVSVFDAKSNLSKLIELALGGDQVVITNRGNPVAELVPFKPAPNAILGLAEGLIDPWEIDAVELDAKDWRPLA